MMLKFAISLCKDLAMHLCWRTNLKSSFARVWQCSCAARHVVSHARTDFQCMKLTAATLFVPPATQAAQMTSADQFVCTTAGFGSGCGWLMCLPVCAPGVMQQQQQQALPGLNCHYLLCRIPKDPHAIRPGLYPPHMDPTVWVTESDELPRNFEHVAEEFMDD